MGIYLIAPPIMILVLAVIPAAVIGFASRAVRRADWLEAKAAAEAAEAAEATEETDADQA